MQLFKTIPVIIVIIISIVGIIGGILSLPDSYKKFRKAFYPHGEKGVDRIVLSNIIKNERRFVTCLVVGDAFHFIKAYLKPKEWGGQFESIEKIGDYYKIVISYPKEKELNFIITKGNKT